MVMFVTLFVVVKKKSSDVCVFCLRVLPCAVCMQHFKRPKEGLDALGIKPGTSGRTASALNC